MAAYEKHISALREILSESHRSSAKDEGLVLLGSLEARLIALTKPKPIAPSPSPVSVKSSCPKCGCTLTIAHP